MLPDAPRARQRRRVSHSRAPRDADHQPGPRMAAREGSLTASESDDHAEDRNDLPPSLGREPRQIVQHAAQVARYLCSGRGDRICACGTGTGDELLEPTAEAMDGDLVQRRQRGVTEPSLYLRDVLARVAARSATSSCVNPLATRSSRMRSPTRRTISLRRCAIGPLSAQILRPRQLQTPGSSAHCPPTINNSGRRATRRTVLTAPAH
jgi:hypothetical protein